MSEVFVVGHLSPDTDTVCSAIVLSELKGFKAVIPEKANCETEFILSRFNIPIPPVLTDVKGKKLFLVDHNESKQSVGNRQGAEVVGVIDHHKIDFKCESPMLFLSEPLGSTCTIIAKYFFDSLNQKQAGLLLSGLLSDTVMFKSPTTTDEDREIAKKLSKLSKLDIKRWGEEVITAKCNISGLSDEELILRDFKEFDFNGKKTGIGYVEVADLKEFSSRKDKLIKIMDAYKRSKSFDFLMFAVADVLNERSELWFVGELKKWEGKPVKGNTIAIGGVVSRKKQIVPELSKIL